MKKIVLGCAAVLLSLGLLAGCNNEDDDIGPGPVVENPNGNDGGEPGPESGASVTGVFGAPDIPLGEYHYATGENGSNGIATTTEWASAGKITITTSAEGTTISNASGEYLNYAPTSSSTTVVQFESSVYYWGVDSDTGAYIDTVSGDSGRFIGLQSTYTVLRAYATSNLSSDSYSAAVLYSTEPEELESPTPLSFELEEVDTPTTGSSYYLGKEVGGVYHLFTGELSGYNLATSTKEDEIALVTVTGSSDSWTITFGESQYVYAYSTSEGYADFGVGTDTEVTTASGNSSFSWNSTLKTFESSVTKTDENKTYVSSYFEYYNGAIALWGYEEGGESSISESSIAHLYQVVDSGEQPVA